MQARSIRTFLGDETGATAIEYGLIAALIAVALLASFAAMGEGLFNLMGTGAGGAADVIQEQLDELNGS